MREILEVNQCICEPGPVAALTDDKPVGAEGVIRPTSSTGAVFGGPSQPHSPMAAPRPPQARDPLGLLNPAQLQGPSSLDFGPARRHDVRRWRMRISAPTGGGLRSSGTGVTSSSTRDLASTTLLTS